MGCSSIWKPSKAELAEIRTCHDIKIQAAQFVRENEREFNEVYRLSHLLCTFGLGEMRVAYHRVSNSKRAVRIFDKSLLKTELARRALLKEIQVLRTLDHPNIMRVFEFFEEVNYTYLVTEFCKGTLVAANVLDYTEEEVATIMQQLLSAIGYMHTKRVVHGNLCPASLCIDSRDSLHVKLIDFVWSPQFTEENLFCKSPEFLNHDYTTKTDLWSCGVILYYLLHGEYPFQGSSPEEIEAQIHKGNIVWKRESLSTEAKDLVQCLLTPEKRRLTASIALKHPWILHNSRHQNTHSAIDALDNLQKFHAANKLSDAVKMYLAVNYASLGEVRELSEVFRRIDLNGDARLSQEELIQEYSKVMDPATAQSAVAKIFDEVDSDNSGFIDYSEFLKAALDMEKLLSTNNIKLAFSLFDSNASGGICARNLKVILEGSSLSNDEVWDRLIDQLDSNGDGEISYEEFLEILRKHV